MPPSTRARLKQAAELYSDFTGHDVDELEQHEIEWPSEGLKVGQCDGILYTTIRDGERENYIHRFKKSARPDFAVSHDGTQLMLLGGKFRFTDRGIVDD